MNQMGDIHDGRGRCGQVQGAQLLGGGYVIVQCIVIWDGGGDSGQFLFGIEGNGLSNRANTKEGNVCCIRLWLGAAGENAELVTDVDFVVASHRMDTERSVCEY